MRSGISPAAATPTPTMCRLRSGQKNRHRIAQSVRRGRAPRVALSNTASIRFSRFDTVTATATAIISPAAAIERIPNARRGVGLYLRRNRFRHGLRPPCCRQRSCRSPLAPANERGQEYAAQERSSSTETSNQRGASSRGCRPVIFADYRHAGRSRQCKSQSGHICARRRASAG
jgi:hypothetical protein